MKDPVTYVAVSEKEGYSLIHQGMPLTANDRTFHECWLVASHQKLVITHIWNGHVTPGTFTELGEKAKKEGYLL